VQASTLKYKRSQTCASFSIFTRFSPKAILHVAYISKRQVGYGSDLTQSALAEQSKFTVDRPSRLVQRVETPAGRHLAGYPPSAEPNLLPKYICKEICSENIFGSSEMTMIILKYFMLATNQRLIQVVFKALSQH
jgi:hypothetical protein